MATFCHSVRQKPNPKIARNSSVFTDQLRMAFDYLANNCIVVIEMRCNFLEMVVIFKFASIYYVRKQCLRNAANTLDDWRL